jgi:hypothetical protein
MSLVIFGRVSENFHANWTFYFDFTDKITDESFTNNNINIPSGILSVKHNIKDHEHSRWGFIFFIHLFLFSFYFSLFFFNFIFVHYPSGNQASSLHILRYVVFFIFIFIFLFSAVLTIPFDLFYFWFCFFFSTDTKHSIKGKIFSFFFLIY